MQREKWIEATLHSADGMSRAESPDMVARVQALIGGRQATMTMTVSSGTLWRIAASVALLLALNVTTLVGTVPRRSGHTDSMEAIFGLRVSGSQQADMGELFFGNDLMSHE